MNRWHYKIAIALGALASLALLALPALAVIDLIEGSFKATALSDRVQIEWQTATEFDNAGFWVRRSTSSSGPFERISVLYQGELVNSIPSADPTGALGASYVVYDTQVQAGFVYYYKLQDLPNDGSTGGLHGPVSVAFGSPTSSSSSTPTASPTPTASSTPTASPTSTGSGSTLPTAAFPATSTPTPTAGIPTTTPEAGTPSATPGAGTPTATPRPATPTSTATLTPGPGTPSATPRPNTPTSTATLTPGPGIPSSTPSPAAILTSPEPVVPAATAGVVPTSEPGAPPAFTVSPPAGAILIATLEPSLGDLTALAPTPPAGATPTRQPASAPGSGCWPAVGLGVLLVGSLGARKHKSRSQ